ncbi:hypothetical protein [Streptomyces sp. MI02-7b]|uniref:hypothetical protein n=1 Tax=Streptomyces sp. MI02-7b TaxID=462941 RepID=UPI0029B3A69E|nr:hypothetical protein [Streptomyces sp. MI02-7b]MDX3077629.1 hypothetical protein [Streptomyces sp. MI02-7b]
MVDGQSVRTGQEAHASCRRQSAASHVGEVTGADRQSLRRELLRDLAPASPDDRPAEVFGGTTTLLSGPERPSHLLVPHVPRAPRDST